MLLENDHIGISLHLFLVLWGIYLEVELLDDTVIIFLTFFYELKHHISTQKVNIGFIWVSK